MQTADHQNKLSVIVGMSGGVDSSVAAYLLLKNNHHVKGIFMKNWNEEHEQGDCTAAIDAEDAYNVCNTLDIEMDAVDFSKEYWDKVFKLFLSEYEHGRTPNPDVLCNKEIKFRAFLDYAISLGANKIATGHYARILEKNGTFFLLKGIDKDKDQSYFLYLLDQSQLSKVIFPLGDYKKSEIRQLAKENGFQNCDKKDSTGICFIGERKFNSFLKNFLPAKKGEIWSSEGEKLGHHEGLMFYTIGQRKGIGLGGKKNSSDEPWFVVQKDLKNNRLIIGQGKANDQLFNSTLNAIQDHWISGKRPNLPLKCCAKTRYRQADQDCLISEGDQKDQLKVDFGQPQRAITPGQSIVFYDNDICLGGAIIENTL